MLSIKKQILLCFAILLFLHTFSNLAEAQNISLNYLYKLEPTPLTEPPKFIGAPQIEYPDAARKNGVEGTLKAYFTISADGSTQNIIVEQTLPFGVEEAVKMGLQKLRFTPAKLMDKPVAVKMYFDYLVTAVYEEDDKNVSKPKIISQPAPVYPAKYLAEKLKGEALVTIMCNADGTVKVLNVNSVLPKEFDLAAAEAAENLKFTPATHKKSKKAVSQEFTVKYKFKP